jgi:hypothetical protein
MTKAPAANDDGTLILLLPSPVNIQVYGDAPLLPPRRPAGRATFSSK